MEDIKNQILKIAPTDFTVMVYGDSGTGIQPAAAAAEATVWIGQRDGLIRLLMKSSGQRLFLTAGEKEVRTWLLRQGGTALEAADNIHTDLARGFIRAEVMTVADLVRMGSEREIKAHHLMRQEPKDYVIKDDDILFIRFSV